MPILDLSEVSDDPAKLYKHEEFRKIIKHRGTQNYLSGIITANGHGSMEDKINDLRHFIINFPESVTAPDINGVYPIFHAIARGFDGLIPLLFNKHVIQGDTVYINCVLDYLNNPKDYKVFNNGLSYHVPDEISDYIFRVANMVLNIRTRLIQHPFKTIPGHKERVHAALIMQRAFQERKKRNKNSFGSKPINSHLKRLRADLRKVLN